MFCHYFHPLDHIFIDVVKEFNICIIFFKTCEYELFFENQKETAYDNQNTHYVFKNEATVYISTTLTVRLCLLYSFNF